MKKISITKKLFIITSLIFAIFIGSTLIIQSLFFEKFYVIKKKRDLSNTVVKFQIDYGKISGVKGAEDLLEEYEGNDNIKIVIVDRENKPKFISKQFPNRQDMIRTRELTDFVKTWMKNPDNIKKLKQDGKIITEVSTRKDNPSRDVIAITFNNEKDEAIFALTSLQPVNEAVSVIEELYKYFCIGAGVFILLLASIYSNMITKPLLRINKVATKMAKLDFSEKCKIQSEDEIGNVAASLNFLSENLSKALSSLKRTNAELERDIEKERELEKMRKEFVAAVSHELKTPISLIDGYAVGLKDHIFEGEEQDFYLDIIIDETRKMGSLVSEMLDLSHLESGNFELIREEFCLTDLIQFTLRKYESIIFDKGLEVKVNLVDGVSVYADWNRLEQVLTNFITNALRHVNEYGTISLRMRDTEDAVSVEVENTGSKIPEEEISKIWDKFYKIDKSRTRKFGGTGIGLSIVKNILMLHGYSFGVKNTEQGVKFYFKIPKSRSLTSPFIKTTKSL